LDTRLYEVALAECSYTFENPVINLDQHVLSIVRIGGIYNPNPSHGETLLEFPKAGFDEYGIKSSVSNDEYISKNVWEYAKNNNCDIRHATYKFEGKQTTKENVVLKKVTVQLEARKQLVILEDLFNELKELMENFGITLEIGTNLLSLKFTYDKPYAQCRLEFSDDVGKIFNHLGTSFDGGKMQTSE